MRGSAQQLRNTVSRKLRLVARVAWSGVRPLVLLAILVLSQVASIWFLTPFAHAVPVQVILTSGTTWTVPPAWDSTNNSIEAIGAGGDGALAVGTTYAGAGGGGGEYRKATNVTLTPNSTINIHVSSGGDGAATDGTWVENNSSTKVVEAKNGGNASGTTAGAGGTGGTGSAANFNGGAGGAGAAASNTASAGGGGGSAGPTGVGKAGGIGQANVRNGGGGGGGSNGGSSTVGVTPTFQSQTGGNGGGGTSGTGGGSGGTGSNSANAGNGSDGGGGGGASNSTGSGTADGGAGGIESLWDVDVGPSGGGGGAGGANGTGRSGSALGGNGGTYGGGGGGGGMSGSNVSAGGSGGQGIIVITYEPTLDPVITQADYRWFENPAGLSTLPWQGCRTESGATNIPTGTTSVTVTLSQAISDMNQAFIISNASGTSNVTNGDDHLVTGQITNATTLTFTRGAVVTSGSGTELSYAMVECFRDEFSVQRGVTTISSGSSSNTASVSTVDTSKSMVLVSNYSDDASTNEQTSLATGELQNSTTVLLRRYDSPTVNSTVAWQVVTLSDSSNATVQTGETTLGSGAASQTATINSIDPDHSWLYCSYDADSNGLRQTAVGCDLTDATTVTVNRYSSSAYVNRVRWYVVTFPDSGVNVQRGSVVDTGSTTDNARYDIEITLPNEIAALDKAFPFATNTTNGTGTAFPRNQWITLLTSTTNLERTYWRGSNNGNGTHYWQVMEFASAGTDVGSPQAAENTAATLRSAGRYFRLRILLGVSDATLGQDKAFKLQYAALSGSCAASSYADVTTSTTMAFHNFDEISNGSTVTTNANDPVDGGNTTEAQTYVESNNFANSQSALSPGEDGLWDFSLSDNGAAANTTYCFRVVNDDGSPLDVYSHYPQITTSDGVFQTDIVDSGGVAVANPSVTMSSAIKDIYCTTTTGTLGTSGQRMRVVNHSSNRSWTLSIAATDGNTALWNDGSALFDFNDTSGAPPGCSAGSDADVYAGQLGFGFGSATVSPESGCSSTDISLGSSAGFEEGVTDSVTLMSAGATAEMGCYWDLQNVDLSQTIPPGQAAGDYSIDLTITVVAN